MSRTKKKIGDQIRITAGRYKDQVGVITGKERRGWTVELEDGSNEGGERRQVDVPFPMAALVEASAQTEQPDGEQAQQTAEAESPVAAAGSPRETDPTPQGEAVPTPETTEGGQDLTKLTVKQLQALAKRHGIGIARTKADFLRIIKAKHPDEDLQRLKGKALFDRVSELHISRLRSKEEMVRLLSD